ncbi:MAG: hypothetical protein PQJ49_08015 [Sphaerochaetaceae bacterium]|nr:hypothetical protein [Sphaerochaetaceae bacterium]
MRTNEEIDRQIEGLEDMKEWLPEYSAFGNPNWQMLEAQMLILNSEMFLEDFGDLDELEPDTEEYDIYMAAEEAEDWLYGNSQEDLFETR